MVARLVRVGQKQQILGKILVIKALLDRHFKGAMKHLPSHAPLARRMKFGTQISNLLKGKLRGI